MIASDRAGRGWVITQDERKGNVPTLRETALPLHTLPDYHDMGPRAGSRPRFTNLACGA